MQSHLKYDFNLSLDDIENELRQFETKERVRLGMDTSQKHWHDPNPQNFDIKQRKHTTILFGGLTIMQDRLIEAGLTSLGYRIKALDCPDNNSLQFGKEFGNRGQCNPTYFTVGNLIKFLVHLRDVQGMDTKDIVDNYIFGTVGACGPCRFGTYATEYRKALRDAGFKQFRVFLFSTGGGIKQGDENHGLSFTPKFFIKMFKCIMLGDILNIAGYRIRPYEIQPGSTDKALNECKEMLTDALQKRKLLLPVLWRCRKILKNVKTDRTKVKPKVSIIGEFWATTTEGDGNYRLQRFLEKEGAECDIQPVTNWLLYIIWGVNYDTKMNIDIRRQNTDINIGQINSSPVFTLFLTRISQTVVKMLFSVYTRTIGLSNYHLADMDEIAKLGHKYYKNELRGGEGHMEVGKLLQYIEKNKTHLVISVKPFGCMPSSGVSDGVQSLVVSKYPNANFIPIETSGDSAVNAHSRIQMALFKARQKAQAEFDQTCNKFGIAEIILAQLSSRKAHAMRYPKQRVAGTAANLVYEMFSDRF